MFYGSYSMFYGSWKQEEVNISLALILSAPTSSHRRTFEALRVEVNFQVLPMHTSTSAVFTRTAWSKLFDLNVTIDTFKRNG